MPKASPKPPPHQEAFADRRRDPDSKREAILRTAVRLFLDNGYTRTSLTDVAEQLNITKPALYYYFHNKEDILLECYRWGVTLVEQRLEEAEGQCRTGLEKVAVFVDVYASAVTVDFARCVARIDDRELSSAARPEVRRYKRAIDRKLRQFIQEGIADGSISPCDPKIAAFLVAGAVTSISTWYEPHGSVPAEAVVQQFIETLTRGLSGR